MRTLWIAGVVLLLDQISKWVVLETMVGRSIPVLGSFFRLTYVENRGGVFGLRLGGPYTHLAFAAAALILVVVLLWRMPASERLGAVGLSLVLGGALGNIADRILHDGAVIDFLDFGIASLRWWVFNVADACVTTGTALLMLSYGFQRHEEDAPDGDADPAR